MTKEKIMEAEASQNKAPESLFKALSVRFLNKKEYSTPYVWLHGSGIKVIG